MGGAREATRLQRIQCKPTNATMEFSAEEILLFASCAILKKLLRPRSSQVFRSHSFQQASASGFKLYSLLTEPKGRTMKPGTVVTSSCLWHDYTAAVFFVSYPPPSPCPSYTTGLSNVVHILNSPEYKSSCSLPQLRQRKKTLILEPHRRKSY